MSVDGSVTPQSFFITSQREYDVRVTGVIIIIADSAVVHSSFGNVAALAN
jgi:hypothetical protein